MAFACFAAVAAQAQVNYEPYSFTTLAGQSRYGSNGGPGSTARFYYPFDAAVDSAGNVFVADTANSVIRKITPSGEVSVFAGAVGSLGTSNGVGTSARFVGPSGIVIDAADNIFVTDFIADNIRKITSVGVVTTFAGLGGATGSVDGTGTGARFNSPIGIDMDAAGTLYVADSGNHTIRKITPSAVVTTLAGLAGNSGTQNGTGNEARFNEPVGIAVDGSGNVYVSDASHRVRKVTSAGVVSSMAGLTGLSGQLDGTGSSASFDEPSGLAADPAGNVYVADFGNGSIRRITPAGIVTTFAGVNGEHGTADGNAAMARFFGPYGVEIDAGGNLYVTDSLASAIRRVSSAGVVTTIAGPAGAYGAIDAAGTAARFNGPAGTAVDSAGNIYISDTFNNAIRKVTPSGTVTTFAGNPGTVGSANGTGSAARFSTPAGIAVDSAGNLYVADSQNHVIRRITSAGVVTTFAGITGSRGNTDGPVTAARFASPSDVAIDSSGNVYVADYGNDAIRLISPEGIVSTFAGSSGISGSLDGTGGDARFSNPTSLTVDSSGNVYVSDEANATIRKITPAGVVTTFAGEAGSTGSADGTGPAARFNDPGEIAFGPDGNLYLADRSNSTIRKITPAGVVTTLAGSPGITGHADGSGPTARFGLPYGIAVSSAGIVYVTDAGNDLLLAGTLPLFPSFTIHPTDSTVGAGTSVVFRATATGSPTYQWYRNGVPISGATSSTLFLTGVGSAEAGSYTVVATNSLGSATSNAAVLTVADSGTTAGYLSALSLRGNVGSGADVFFIGFVLRDSGGRVLVKAVGPGIAAPPYNVPGAMANPQLSLQVAGSSTLIAENDDWGGSGELIDAISATASFPLADISSRDAAILRTLGAGTYIATASGASNTTGVTLVEFYGLDTPANLNALALRGNIGAGADVFFVGFVIRGSTSKTVLIKNVGPGIAAPPYSVPGAMADPTLLLYQVVGSENVTIGANDNWGGSSALVTANSLANAFPLTDGGSLDSALLVTLSPGVYIVRAAGNNETTGVGLIEIYGL